MSGAALRNALIVAGLAAIVAFVPQGGHTAQFVAQVITILFTILVVLFVARMYQTYRTEIFGLGDRHRALLYGSVGVAVLAMAAVHRLFATGIGILVWFVLVGGASFGLYTVWRQYREYRI